MRRWRIVERRRRYWKLVRFDDVGDEGIGRRFLKVLARDERSRGGDLVLNRNRGLRRRCCVQ